jgi:hypothetical protein
VCEAAAHSAGSGETNIVNSSKSMECYNVVRKYSPNIHFRSACNLKRGYMPSHFSFDVSFGKKRCTPSRYYPKTLSDVKAFNKF